MSCKMYNVYLWKVTYRLTRYRKPKVLVKPKQNFQRTQEIKLHDWYILNEAGFKKLKTKLFTKPYLRGKLRAWYDYLNPFLNNFFLVKKYDWQHGYIYLIMLAGIKLMNNYFAKTPLKLS